LLAEAFAESNFRQSGESAKVTNTPAVEGFEQAVGFFFLITFDVVGE